MFIQLQLVWHISWAIALYAYPLEGNLESMKENSFMSNFLKIGKPLYLYSICNFYSMMSYLMQRGAFSFSFIRSDQIRSGLIQLQQDWIGLDCIEAIFIQILGILATFCLQYTNCTRFWIKRCIVRNFYRFWIPLKPFSCFCWKFCHTIIFHYPPMPSLWICDTMFTFFVHTGEEISHTKCDWR